MRPFESLPHSISDRCHLCYIFSTCGRSFSSNEPFKWRFYFIPVHISTELEIVFIYVSVAGVSAVNHLGMFHGKQFIHEIIKIKYNCSSCPVSHRFYKRGFHMDGFQCLFSHARKNYYLYMSWTAVFECMTPIQKYCMGSTCSIKERNSRGT